MNDGQPTHPDAAAGKSPPEESGLSGLTDAVGGLDSASGEPAVPDHDPLLGKDLGGVTIVRLIAEGGMGRVYEGLQARPRRPVAVKVMRPGFVSREACRRFDNEAEVLGRLRHQSIAQIFSAGICNVVGAQVPYFVMEYIPDALPISHYATRHKLTTEQRIELFRKVCEAVAHGHEKGVVHRDLKPSNILVEASGLPKVIDFGVARSVDASADQMTALTDMGQLIGTVQYMSPEQFTADPSQIDMRADVYALGVILYELLTEKPPYEIRRKQIFEAAEVVRKRKPVAPSKLNSTIRPDVEKITGTCLQKDRSRRYANAAELAHELGSYLGGQPVQGTSSAFGSNLWGMWEATPRWRKGLVVAAGIVSVAVVMVGLIAGWRTPQPEGFTNSLGMTMVPVPAGRFTIGSPPGEASRGLNEAQNVVHITNSFWIGSHEVTQDQWKRVMGTQPWIEKRDLVPQGDAPALCISWNDAVYFCRKLTDQERNAGSLPDGTEYRLPTEAEWEYACRAGSDSSYGYGNDAGVLDRYAWYRRNVRDVGKAYPQPVGMKLPNPWGLYDLHGNVWEWVLDSYGAQPPKGSDPICRAATEKRLLRGGSWYTPAADLRSARRYSGPGALANNRFSNAGDLGFRVVLGRVIAPPISSLPPQAPTRLLAFRGSVDKKLTFEATGHDKCEIRGNNPYTDDSCLATATVHAGVLKPGERGLITVELIPGLQKYEGTLANGVLSGTRGPWPNAFRIQKARQRDGDDSALQGTSRADITLADLPVKRSLVGWNSLRTGHLKDILINGVVPASVIVAHASSLVVYDLPDAFDGRLQGEVALSGLSKAVQTPGSCRFRILGDDTLLWESGVIDQDRNTGDSVVEKFNVTLAGFRTVSLEVDSLGANHSDWSVWSDPVLHWSNGEQSIANRQSVHVFPQPTRPPTVPPAGP